MKRFVFKLQNVLKYRETLETLAKNVYSEAARLLNIETDKLHEIEERRDESIAAFNKLKSGSEIDPEMFNFLSNYTSQLLFLMDSQKQVILEKEKAAKEKLEAYNEKRKDVKVIKRLEEKKWKEYLREMDKEEQAFQDEIFLAKTAREMAK